MIGKMKFGAIVILGIFILIGIPLLAQISFTIFLFYVLRALVCIAVFVVVYLLLKKAIKTVWRRFRKE